MGYYKPVKVEDLQNLQLRIHVIGYYPQGECILLVIYDAGNRVVLRSIVIDSYRKQKETNQLFALLNEYGISLSNPIDMIIWTHPDRDHSKGIPEIIANYAGSQTKVVMPDGIGIETIDKRDELALYKVILGRIAKKTIRFDRVNVNEDRAYPPMLMPIVFHKDFDRVYFSIEILTPFSDDVTKKTQYNKSFDNNDVSLSAIIRFGELKLYFGGDVENAAIKRIQPLKFNNLNFIKIPHHGSDSSDEFPRILENLYCPKEDSENDDVEKRVFYDEYCGDEYDDEVYEDTKQEDLPPITSVSTCFQTGKADDPLESVLELYKPFSHRICLTDYEKRRYRYGVWTFVYNAQDGNCLEEDCQCTGDAGVWYDEDKEDRQLS